MGLLGLPRRELEIFAPEVPVLAQAAASQSSDLLRPLEEHFGVAVVGAWLQQLALSRCKALKVAVLPDKLGRCATCGEAARLRCSQCKAASYCSEGCQRDDWRGGHRLACTSRASSQRHPSRIAVASQGHQ